MHFREEWTLSKNMDNFPADPNTKNVHIKTCGNAHLSREKKQTAKIKFQNTLSKHILWINHKISS